MSREQRCQGCGYDLSRPPEHIPEPRCPECGLHYLAGEHPSPNWPGAAAVYFESCGFFCVIVALGLAIATLPAGAGMGAAVVIAGTAMGIVGPWQASSAYGVRFGTRPARWRTRRRVLAVALAANTAVLLVAGAVLRVLW
jgi:hypothetical protein